MVAAGAGKAPSPVDRLLRTAIAEKRLVQFKYKSHRRIVEPHDYGIFKGALRLLAFQVAGGSSGPLPNWRWIEVDGIMEAELLDRTFQGHRTTAAQNHHQWDELFVRVD